VQVTVEAAYKRGGSAPKLLLCADKSPQPTIKNKKESKQEIHRSRLESLTPAVSLRLQLQGHYDPVTLPMLLK
jgi:hypothetical protein